jgi:hypothetical protein
MSETPQKPLFQRLREVEWEAFLVEENHLSMGRLMAWLLLGLLVYMWLTEKVVPDTLFHIFILLLSYNFGKKLTHPLSAMVELGGKKKRSKFKKKD